MKKICLEFSRQYPITPARKTYILKAKFNNRIKDEVKENDYIRTNRRRCFLRII